METPLILLAFLLSIIGIIGCIVPGLPGLILNYFAMWCMQWAIKPFSISLLIVFGVLTILVLILDYLIPIWTGKKFGATQQGIIGSIAGMMAGIFFTPIGMFAGMIAGAVLGDLIAGRSGAQAARSGIATFFGTLVSIGMKLLLAGVITSIIIFKFVSYRWNNL
ncbi:MAG: DUF456 domain-containing protein [Chitinophagales bacterium]|nr:DUF456 domain-containing protein [Chitinophagales bacterium]